MAIPATVTSLADALQQVKAWASAVKNGAQASLSVLQAGPVDTKWVFGFLDDARLARDSITSLGAVPGLDGYATAQWPNYAGTLSADITTVVSNINGCISWVVTNFPKDTAGFAQGFKINADGTRTASSFTSAQTVGLQNTLQTLIASIG